jgi:hypothetical protein
VRGVRKSTRVGLEYEAERIGAFLELEPALSITSS